MAVLDDLKIVLNPNIDSSLLNIYIRKGVTLIINYLQLETQPYTTVDSNNVSTIVQPIDVTLTYPDALIEYVTICVNKRGNEGLKQFSQASRSGSYGNDLPDSVKALLPKPFIRMRSTFVDSGVYNA